MCRLHACQLAIYPFQSLFISSGCFNSPSHGSCLSIGRQRSDLVLHAYHRETLHLRRIGGTNAQEGGIYGSQGRDDYEDIDLEHYFNYIGALAEDGTYDRLYALSDSGLEPIDAILVCAASHSRNSASLVATYALILLFAAPRCLTRPVGLAGATDICCWTIAGAGGQGERHAQDRGDLRGRSRFVSRLTRASTC